MSKHVVKPPICVVHLPPPWRGSEQPSYIHCFFLPDLSRSLLKNNHGPPTSRVNPAAPGNFQRDVSDASGVSQRNAITTVGFKVSSPQIWKSLNPQIFLSPIPQNLEIIKSSSPQVSRSSSPQVPKFSNPQGRGWRQRRSHSVIRRALGPPSA